jgi:hypothetical protein
MSFDKIHFVKQPSADYNPSQITLVTASNPLHQHQHQYQYQYNGSSGVDHVLQRPKSRRTITDSSYSYMAHLSSIGLNLWTAKASIVSSNDVEKMGKMIGKVEEEEDEEQGLNWNLTLVENESSVRERTTEEEKEISLLPRYQRILDIALGVGIRSRSEHEQDEESVVLSAAASSSGEIHLFYLSVSAHSAQSEANPHNSYSPIRYISSSKTPVHAFTSFTHSPHSSYCSSSSSSSFKSRNLHNNINNISIKNITAQKAACTSIQFNQDCTILASIGTDSKLILSSVESLAPHTTITNIDSKALVGMQYRTPTEIVVATESQRLKLVDLRSKKPTAVTFNPPDYDHTIEDFSFTSLAVHPTTSSRLATGDTNGCVHIWDLRNLTRPETLAFQIHDSAGNIELNFAHSAIYWILLLLYAGLFSE